MSQGWGIEVDAQDFLSHQKRRADIEIRRPTPRKASDFVGPGIGPTAVRITNYNDILATYNGYFSSAPGALNAPNATEGFVGHVVMDSTLGGKQVFTGMVSGNEYRRVFQRNPADPSSIIWPSGWEAGPAPSGYTQVGATVDVANISTAGVNIPGLSISVTSPGPSAVYKATLELDYETNGTIWAPYLLVDGQPTGSSPGINTTGRQLFFKTYRITGLSAGAHTLIGRVSWLAGNGFRVTSASTLSVERMS